MLARVTEVHFERIRERYAGASIRPLPSGAALVTVPSVPLPPGWSAKETTVYFLVPVGYPGPTPDCFWADQGLLLANGTAPQASNVSEVPEGGLVGRWFSWHVVGAQQHWNPNRDDLMTFMSIIRDRFQQAQ